MSHGLFTYSSCKRVVDDCSGASQTRSLLTVISSLFDSVHTNRSAKITDLLICSNNVRCLYNSCFIVVSFVCYSNRTRTENIA